MHLQPKSLTVSELGGLPAVSFGTQTSLNRHRN
jgi:hypothetical protein